MDANNNANKLINVCAELFFVLSLSYAAYYVFNIETMSAREYIFMSLSSYYFFSYLYEKFFK
mgnify:CR=1 FL=1